jgi:hypothetical protein
LPRCCFTTVGSPHGVRHVERCDSPSGKSGRHHDEVGVSSLGKRSRTQHGFLARPDAVMTDLAAQGQSWARDLNDFGVVVGGGGSRQVRAVLWRVP